MIHMTLVRHKDGSYTTKDKRFKVERHLNGWAVMVAADATLWDFRGPGAPQPTTARFADTLHEARAAIDASVNKEMTDKRLAQVFDAQRRLVNEKLCDTPEEARAFVERHRPRFGASYVTLPARPRRKDRHLLRQQPSLRAMVERGMHRSEEVQS